MQKVIITVDWDKNYSAIPANDEVVCAVTGKTLEEVKERMEFSLKKHLSSMEADGDHIPNEFKGNFELEYDLTIRALLHYTEGVVPRKALSKVTGINLQQLSHYAKGWRNPRPDMKKRIVEGIHTIGEHLISISS